MKLVRSFDDIQANIQELELGRASPVATVARVYRKLIKRGTCFVPYFSEGTLCFAPSRFVGYLSNTFQAHAENKDKHDRITNAALSAIIGAPPSAQSGFEERYLEFCARIGVRPSKAGNFGAQRRYWATPFVLEELDRAELNTIQANPGLSLTEKEQLTKARIGQGAFREQLISYWKGCCLTGCSLVSVLKASHIKPWRNSTNAERLDPFNGVLLSPNVDALFDRGLISFEDNGKMIVSPQLHAATLQLLIGRKLLSLPTSPEHAKYLAYHRENVFRALNPNAALKPDAPSMAAR